MASNTGRAPAASKSQDAISMLTADHKRVKKLFSEFKKAHEDGGADEKAALIEQICGALKVHAQLEEEIFYPAVRAAIDEPDLMDEALVEHAGAKSLIEQLESMDPEEDLFDAKVTVLSEQIEHHVKEEEGEMFPKAKKSKLDLRALGAQMLERKIGLQRALGLEGDEEDEEEQEASGHPRGRKQTA